MSVSWKGSISFGLIYIPIGLYIATSEERIGFNMLHNKCNHRIKYKKVCEFCDEEIRHNDIVKGYNYKEDKYVIFDDSDFEKIKTAKDKSIDIVQFVDFNEIDSIFYEKSYYIIPLGAEKAYALLKQALKDTNKVGIAKAVLGTKESLVAIRMSGDNLLLNTLYFLNEIRPIQQPVNTNVELIQNEVDLAKMLIDNMTSSFKPETYHNEYNEKLKLAIKQKIKGKEISVAKEEQPNNIINLMDALQKSVRNTQGPRV